MTLTTHQRSPWYFQKREISGTPFLMAARTDALCADKPFPACAITQKPSMSFSGTCVSSPTWAGLGLMYDDSRATGAPWCFGLCLPHTPLLSYFPLSSFQRQGTAYAWWLYLVSWAAEIAKRLRVLLQATEDFTRINRSWMVGDYLGFDYYLFQY